VSSSWGAPNISKFKGKGAKNFVKNFFYLRTYVIYDELIGLKIAITKNIIGIAHC
jgi:hypothetical protein